MERKRMMDTTTQTKRRSQWWWLDNHSNGNGGRSQWLQSTLSALDDKTKAMLRIIEEDADSFSQRAEMYYKKRPQLVGLVEDFYRAHRSLAEQFDHLRHDPGTRRTSPLARSFSLTKSQPEKAIDPRKSYDGCFTKLARDSEDLFLSPLSKGSPDKSLDRLKPFGGRYADLAYDSDESFDSEVDDPMPEGSCVDDVDDLGEELSSTEMNHADMMAKIDRLDGESMIQMKQLMEKEKAIEELKLNLSESATEVMELKEEVEKLRLENGEIYLLKMKDAEESEKMSMNLKKEKEQLIVENTTLKNLLLQKDEETRESMKLEEEFGALRMEIKEQREMLEEKDEEKREAIRQMSVAIDMLKGENRLLKKALANESNKRWKPFESQVLKGFGKLFNCSIISSQPSVVPL